MDWDFWWKVATVVGGAFIALALFAMRRTYVKTEQHAELDKRVQTVEQTYATEDQVTELQTRVTKLESAVGDLPKLVNRLNEKVVHLEAAAKHFDETIQRIERPINLIVEAAMKGNK
jgi:septal ring factor EnvC (AmiA/AmiB activator)